MSKTALVTGGSRGIGRAAVETLVREGWNVVAAARSEEPLAELEAAYAGRVLARPLDVSDWKAMRDGVAFAEQRFGPLDLLVNNAAVIEPIARLEASDPEAWSRALRINVDGVYHGLRAALPSMRARGSGVVINISSGAAASAYEGWSHYSASKAAVLSLTRTADQENADRGVRVVGLSPGTVATEMQVRIKASGINPVSQLDPRVHIPPAWVGEAIRWLASEDAAEFHGVDVSLRDAAIRARIGLPAG